MRARGLTRLEVVIVMCVGIALAAVLVVLVRPCGPSGGARTVRDSSQLKQIHQSMLAKANETKGGRLPMPGQRTTQALYSSMVAQNLFNCDLLISPAEVNPQVVEYKNYNYDAYQPAADSYWDPGFAANIDAAAGSTQHSNASYAHLVLCGLRAENQWKDSLDAGVPQLANRGVRNGVTTGPEFTRSPTLRIHGPPTSWEGNLCFADNHMEYVETFTPEGVRWQCDTLPLTLDNIFAADFTQGTCVPNDAAGKPQLLAGGDTWLGICPDAGTQYVATPKYDALLPP